MSESTASIKVAFHPRFSANRKYMRTKSPANNADSSPPSPDLTSTITSLLSSGSRGINISCNLSAKT